MPPFPPPPHDGKMEVEVNDRKSDKKHEWEKYLYPFPKKKGWYIIIKL